MAQQVKNPPAVQETQKTRVQSLGWEDPLEKEMATSSNILAWEIPGTEEPCGLHPRGCRELDIPEHILHMIFLDILSFAVQIHC